jgi:xanthosine utilization system XapX-like protein
MKVFYTPFGVIAGIVGARLGKRAFSTIWSTLDGSTPPDPKAGDAALPKVMAAAALEAATMAAIGAAVDRAAAGTFHYLFGAWPGKARREKAAAQGEAA